MASFFLRLELNNLGIKAEIVEQNQKLALIKDRCQILFEDLPDSEQNSKLFDPAMDRIAQKLDLDSCPTAIIFVSPLSVSFRNIDLPFSSEKKAKQILPFEIEPLLQGISEINISDFPFLSFINETNLILNTPIPEIKVEPYFLKLGRFGINC